MEPEKDPKIEFTVEELQEAVGCYELLLPSEVEAAYNSMLAVPQFGLKVAQALQFAAKMGANGKMDKSRILDAAVVPAFLIGLLVGLSRKLERDLLEAPSFDDQMAMLEKCIGKPMRIKYVVHGLVFQRDCVLTAVEPYLLLRTADWYIPFIGTGEAVRQISVVTDYWEQLVYFNPKIPLDYNVCKEADVEILKTECFGPPPPAQKEGLTGGNSYPILI